MKHLLEDEFISGHGDHRKMRIKGGRFEQKSINSNQVSNWTVVPSKSLKVIAKIYPSWNRALNYYLTINRSER